MGRRKISIAILLAVSLVIVDCGGRFGRKGGSKTKRKRVVKTAVKYIGVPYVYGGKTPKGFDCSGFTKYVYAKAIRKRIPAGTKLQSRYGRKKRIPRPGDLMFFVTRGRRISHVGIYLGRGKFIHAPRRGKSVEITSIRNRYWRKAYRYSRSSI